MRQPKQQKTSNQSDSSLEAKVWGLARDPASYRLPGCQDARRIKFWWALGGSFGGLYGGRAGGRGASRRFQWVRGSGICRDFSVPS